MVRSNTPQGGSIIILSIIVSCLLMLIPLADPLRFLRPEFVMLTLIYWAMALPNRVNIGLAWLVGLLMDVMLGGSLGILAFAYAFIIYLVLSFHLQLRRYPLWQQAAIVFSLILLLKIILILAAAHSADWHFWWPATVSMLVWPIIYAVLRGLRRHFHVH